MSGHTPGPWRAKHRHTGAGPHEDEIAGLGWEIYGPPEPLRGQFARAADAHLVAAAPDLLDALEQVLAVPELGGGEWETTARAAVAKAKGNP